MQNPYLLYRDFPILKVYQCRCSTLKTKYITQKGFDAMEVNEYINVEVENFCEKKTITVKNIAEMMNK